MISQKKNVPVTHAVATPAMSVANRVDNAKVKTTVGAADVSAGDRTTVVMQGLYVCLPCLSTAYQPFTDNCI